MSTNNPKIHTVTGQVMPANAFIVETANADVVIDSTLTVSDSRLVKAKLEALDKPLAAVLITHAHPDHYAGLAQIVEDKTPIIALEEVADVIRRDDASKNEIVDPMMGDEWSSVRPFPNQTLQDGESVTFDGVRFKVLDMGAAESPANSIWHIEGTNIYFVGDLVYHNMHAYLADGCYQEWLGALDKWHEALPEDALLYQGHGDAPVSKAKLSWQRTYIERFVEAVRSSSGEGLEQQVIQKMKDFLPNEDLLFLMQLSIASIKEQLGGL